MEWTLNPIKEGSCYSLDIHATNMYIHIHISCWVHFLCFCIFGFKAEHSVLDKNQGVHQWERLTSPAVIFACNALNPTKFSSFCANMFIDIATVHACLCSHFKKLSLSRLPGILAFIIFYPLPAIWYFLSHRCQSTYLDAFIQAALTMI